jgi:hypothetical protein
MLTHMCVRLFMVRNYILPLQVRQSITPLMSRFYTSNTPSLILTLWNDNVDLRMLIYTYIFIYLFIVSVLIFCFEINVQEVKC